MTDLRQAAQALLDRWDSPLWKNGSTANAIADLRAALEQQQAEPSQWRDMVVVNLVREGVNKHKARELADHFAAPPQRKPLTDEQVHKAMIALNTQSCGELQPTFEEMKVAIEAAHNIKEQP